MLKEFKAFALKGNMVDMTIGVIVGTALGAVAKSLVTDVIMPPVGLFLGNVDFSELFLTLKDGSPGGPYATIEKAKGAGAVTINYGLSVNTVVSFLIVVALMFLLVTMITRLQSSVEPPLPVARTKECPHCLSVIPEKATRCANCTSTLGA